MQTRAFPFPGDASLAPVGFNIPASHRATLDYMQHGHGVGKSIALQRVVEILVADQSKVNLFWLYGRCVGKFTMMHSHPQLMQLTVVIHQCTCQSHLSLSLSQGMLTMARHARSFLHSGVI